MTDEIKSNLEPIKEEDLNLKEKFTGNEKKKNSDKGVEQTPSPEQKAEKKEGVVEKEAAYNKIISQASNQQQLSSEEDVQADAEITSKAMDAESKINSLVNVAENKGVVHAVKVARHMEDNYTLDEFHDRLLGDELHAALVKKGLIKEV